MNGSVVFERLAEIGVIPVIKIENAGSAVPLGKALLDGGIPVAEVTFRTDAAEEAIGILSEKYPDLITGAGTVLTIEQADRAVRAGARFIVSPGLNSDVVRHCVKMEVPVIPGCCTPSDIENALGLGLNTVKFFPAEASGGVDMLKALSAPYGMVRFIPTGGIDLKNLAAYLAFGKVLACGGSWMVKEDLITQGRFDEITRLCRETMAAVMGFEPAHVGINANGCEDALGLAGCFSRMFDLPVRDGNSSCFAGSGIEVVKENGLGKNGHIAISTNNIKRARAYLKGRGFDVDMSTAKFGPSGQMIAVYLKEEAGGFAIHLLQK